MLGRLVTNSPALIIRIRIVSIFGALGFIVVPIYMILSRVPHKKKYSEH